MPVYLTPREVAARLRVHVETIRRAIRKGELVAVRLGHRTLRVSEEALSAWVKGQEGRTP